VSAAQGVLLTFLCITFATANRKVGEVLNIIDAGGMAHSHLFGSAFGLVAAMCIATRVDRFNSVIQLRTRATGAFGLFGALVLFITFSVFNSANLYYWLITSGGVANLASNDIFHSDPQLVINAVSALTTRAYINTLCGISASVIAAFCATYLISGGRANLAAIQRATLSGGVAIAMMAPVAPNPYATIAVGYITAWISVLILQGDYASRSPAMLGAYDAGGVLATHLVPGLIGMIAAAVTFARDSPNVSYAPYDQANYAAFVTAGHSSLGQGGYQVAYCLISVLFGAIAGAISGLISNVFVFEPAVNGVTYADDGEGWVGGADAMHVAPVPVIVK